MGPSETGFLPGVALECVSEAFENVFRARAPVTDPVIESPEWAFEKGKKMANETATPATVARNARKSAAAELAELKALLAERDARIAAAEAELAEAKVQAETAKKATVASGYKGYADKEISPAVKRFCDWLRVEFPELYGVPRELDERLVFITNKAYSHFQKSAANRDENGKALGRKA
jgi:hypothetical protein